MIEKQLTTPNCPSCGEQMKPAGGIVDGKNNPTTDWACWNCNERTEDIAVLTAN